MNLLEDVHFRSLVKCLLSGERSSWSFLQSETWWKWGAMCPGLPSNLNTKRSCNNSGEKSDPATIFSNRWPTTRCWSWLPPRIQEASTTRRPSAPSNVKAKPFILCPLFYDTLTQQMFSTPRLVRAPSTTELVCLSLPTCSRFTSSTLVVIFMNGIWIVHW